MIKKIQWTHKPVTIQNLGAIQRELLSLVPSVIPDVENLKPAFTDISVSKVKDNLPTLCDQFNQWGILDRWQYMAFITGNRGSSVSMHVDTLEWEQLTLALNIPVLNCDDSYTAFYNAQTLPVRKFRKNDPRYTARMCDESTAEEITRIQLNKPYWVNICVPHKPIMNHNNPRILASFRFGPELFDVIDNLVDS
jgi:hypothetical protein